MLLTRACFYTMYVGGISCNTDKLPECVSFPASAMFKRNNNNK